MNCILFDEKRENFLPFSHTRAIADIRCGVLTMRERWEKLLGCATGTITAPYLQPLYGQLALGDTCYINGAVAGSKQLVSAINALEPGQILMNSGSIIAAHTTSHQDLSLLLETFKRLTPAEFTGECTLLKHPWDIFSLNDKLIREDFTALTEGRESAPLPEGVLVSGKEHLFIEAGAVINAGCIINATTGPVYIGKKAELLEGTMIRGPLAVCEGAGVKMGAKIYGATTIGPGCKVGGEVNNVVFFANSNKGHDGYLGNAVIGEWCNLGADTNCSNLKNNYDLVKVWDESQNKLVSTGLIFCGLMMGDHSKCGINTMFNTGAVVGVSANIYGGGFPDKFIPSFSWGGSDGMVTYEFGKAMETAERMMQRRGKQLSAAELTMYQYIFNQTAPQREP